MALKLGDVNFGLGVDAKGMEKGLMQIVNFGAKVDAAAKKTAKGSKEIAAALLKQEQAALRAVQATASMNQQSRKANLTTRATEKIVKDATAAYNQNVTALTRGKLSMVDYSRVQSKFTADLGRTKRELQKLASNIKDPTDKVGNLNTKIRNLSSASVLAVGPLSGIGARISALGAIATRSSVAFAALAAGIAVGVVASAKMSVAAVRVAFELDKVNARLVATSDTMTEVNAEFLSLRSLADKAGVSFISVANSFTKIKAAANGTAAESTMRQMFEDIVIASAKFRLDAAETEGTLKAIEQIMSKGTVQAEELRGQLGDRLPGAFTIAARAMKVSTAELNAMLKAGLVMSNDFLPKFAAELRKTFGADSTMRVNSLQASQARLTDSFMFLNMAMDEAFGISRTYKAIIEGITSVVKAAEQNIDVFYNTLILTGAAMLAIAGPGIIKGFRLMIGLIKSATIVMTGFNAAVAANPLGALATIATRVVLALLAAAGAVVLFSSSAKASSNDVDEVTSSVDDYIRSLDTVEETIAEQTSNKIEQVSRSLRTQAEAIREALRLNEQMRAAINASGNKLGIEMAEDGTGFGVAVDMGPLLAAQTKLKAQLKDLLALLDKQTAAQREAEEAERAAMEARIATGREEIEMLVQRTAALEEGGQAVESLNRSFDRTKAIEKYIKDFGEINNLTQALATAMIEEFTQAYDNMQKVIANNAMSDASDKMEDLSARIAAAKEGAEALAELERAMSNNAAVESFSRFLKDTTLTTAEAAIVTAEYRRHLELLDEVLRNNASSEALKALDEQLSTLQERLNASQGGTKALKEFEDALDMSETIQSFSAGLDKVSDITDEGKAARLYAYAKALEEFGVQLKRNAQSEAAVKIADQVQELTDRLTAAGGGVEALQSFETALNIEAQIESFRQGFIAAGDSGDVLVNKIALVTDMLWELNSVLAQTRVDAAFSKAADKVAAVNRETQALLGTAKEYATFQAQERTRQALATQADSLKGGNPLDVMSANIKLALAMERKQAALDAFRERNRKSRKSSGGGDGGDDALEAAEGLFRLNQELARSEELLEAMKDGPATVALLNEEFAREDAIANFRDRLIETEVPLDVVNEKLAQFIATHDGLKAAKQQVEDLKNIWDTVTSSMEEAFMSIIDGTKTVSEAFKEMALQIIRELYRVLVVQKLVNSIVGAISGGAAGTPTGNNVNVKKSAKGNIFSSQGVINAPTAFQYGNGKLGTMAENKPEGVLPLSRGPDGKLGVIVNGGSSGGGGDHFKIDQHFQIQATGETEFDQMLTKRMPAIMNMAMVNLIDKNKRGQIKLHN